MSLGPSVAWPSSRRRARGRPPASRPLDLLAMTDAARSYEVLARRYRSRGFEEVVGQEAIASTLRNAIENHRTAHAYLFCGTRGVGKTSMARIFAKALNASGGLLGEEAAVGNAILQGRDVDVIEIDAASNRGIDDARDLIASAGIAPMRGPYRIYIIDEVHMLTPAAFNALLKTMEEPPRHVKFILCTTEPHQVPATIQSRCQRFDFRAISASRIAAHLAAVLEQEKITSEPEVLHRIARMANGSMRDALSLLDRLASGATGTLTARQLEELFGLPEDSVIDAILAAIGRGDAGATLRDSAQLLDRGLTAERLLDSLAERLRELLVVATCGAESELLETPAERREALAAVAEAFDPAQISSLIALCDAVGRSSRSSSSPRALLDAALVRMAMSERFAESAALLAGGGGTPAKKLLAPVAGAAEVVRPRRVMAEPRSAPPVAPVATVEPKPTPPSPPPSSVSPAASSASPAASTATPLDLEGLWSRLRAAVAGSARRAALLESIEPVAFDGRTLLVRPSASGASRWLETRPEPLLELLREVAGRAIAVGFEAVEREAPRPSSEHVSSPLLEHPLVKKAVEILDGTVVRVMPTVAWGTTEGAVEGEER
ncbi:MAG: DNA polymerase III subunit gamma/tau [Phycisphaerae bacterium]|nr:DNA polymerase III subunit gamma/tau [Phycisphaerae bacterium]